MRMRYSRGMEYADKKASRHFGTQEKETSAVIARNFSASRMNATKWRETIEALSDLPLNYRFQWVHVPGVSDWMNIWIPYPHSTYFDTGPAGPFKTFVIERLEIDAIHQWGANGSIMEQDSSAEIERRLQEINVPYDWVDGNIRIIGYVRNG